MSGHPIIDTGRDNLPVLTVGELAQALKRHIERGFDAVRVRGEITGFKRAASGHLYFSLKDTHACLDSICWRLAANRLGIAPQDGLDVIATGRLTTYPDRSKYQLVVESLELAGEGALLRLLEERRRRLAAEGLFDAARKKPIPFLPNVIGVVTSPTGAVIRDILHRLADRFPRRVLLWPVLVQGPEAAEQVAAAIAGFNRLSPGAPVPRPDVLIVARGGGSLEDLWAFNEEIVARAVAASAIPVIGAVGHETDTTLVDFAADLRAPTPSAAAEMAVPVRMELAARLLTLNTRLLGGMNRTIEEKRSRLLAARRGLPNPQNLLAVARQRLDDWGDRLRQGLAVGLDRRQRRLAHAAARLASPTQRIAHERSRLAGESRALDAALRAYLLERGNRLRHVAALLDSFSYERVLERGFALVQDRLGQVVTSVKALRPRLQVSLRFADGKVGATIDSDASAPRAATRRSDADQGTLL
jgi:exodeoxyribonuclease VII large subunit